MKSFIVLTPGIKSDAGIPALSKWEQATHVFLTNSLYQQSWAEKADCTIVNGDDLSASARAEDINDRAKAWAREWCSQTEIEETLNYRDINLGDLNTRLFTYHLVALLKAYSIVREFIEKQKPARVFLYDDKTYWGVLFRELCEEYDIEVLLAYAKAREEDVYEKALQQPAGGSGLKSGVKGMLGFFNKVSLKLETGSLLFSSAPKFLEGVLKDNPKSYYVRDVYSVKGKEACKKYGSYHIIPQDFAAANPKSHSLLAEIPQKIKTLDAYFCQSKYFTFEGYDFWPHVKRYWQELLGREAGVVGFWIDSFYQIITVLKPRALMLDEDVCVFNKALARVAKCSGIPSFVLMHGLPYFDIGTIPGAADYILTWGDSSQRRLREWSVSSEKLLDVGAPQYCEAGLKVVQYDKEVLSRRLGITAKEPWVFYAMSSFRTNEHPDFVESPLAAANIFKIADLMIQFLREVNDVRTIMKFHPADKNMNRVKEYFLTEGKDVAHRMTFTSEGSSLDYIEASEFTVTYGSTVYLEALLSQKPVYMFDQGTHRAFSILGDEYLDFEEPDFSVQKMEELTHESVQKYKISRQNLELESHFKNSNKNVSVKTEELLERVNQAVGMAS